MSREATYFKSGQSGNPKGRPKGARHRLSEDFIAALCDDFEEHGPAVIARVREDRPTDYLKIVVSVLPKETRIQMDPLEGLSDQELRERIADIDDAIREVDPNLH